MEHNHKLYLTKNEEVLFDDHYRYIISQIETNHVVRKGTCVTVLENMNSFCEELMFDKKLLVKIIGKKLSCKTGLGKDDKYYLQGKYDKQQIKTVVYLFIQEYLLCVNCDKPEVDLRVKHEQIKQKCRACGNNVYLENYSEEIIHLMKNAM